MSKTSVTLGIVLGLAMSGMGRANAADWPMWRFDAGRTASTPHALPDELHQRWVREFPPPEPAWPEEPRLHFDVAYQPVVAGKTMFVCLNRSDKLVALDTETGRQKWVFYAGGPMRFAPVAWKGRVLAVSDDGCLYCLDASSGRMRWKFRGAAKDRRLLGNGRLISMWPARGGPVMVDGRVYFAAGIWPFMGVFIHALDAESGRPIWINDGSGAQFSSHPHGATAFGGVAPQGYLALVNDTLIVPSGRSRPAGFDRDSGELLYFDTGWKGGNCHVTGIGSYFFNGSYLFDAATGGLGFDLSVGRRNAWDARLVLTEETAYTAEEGTVFAYDLSDVTVPAEVSEKLKHDYEYRQFEGRRLQAQRLDALADVVWIKAGSRLYTSRGETVTAFDLPRAEQTWTGEVKGPIGAIIAADDKLFVSTRDGRIYCFAATGSPQRHAAKKRPEPPAEQRSGEIEQILKISGVSEGYCLVWGLRDGRLMEELARRSGLRVIGVDADEQKVDALRRRLDAAGLYGTRIAVHAGDPSSFPFPPYCASLIVSENPERAGLGNVDFTGGIVRALRPYGGVACLGIPRSQQDGFLQRLKAARLPGVEVKASGDYCLLTRVGALPGSADWTHQGADPGNSRASKDQLVKLPLGVLWFGGPAGGDIFWDRHAGAPRPQVVGGRLIAAGPGTLHAVDVYTGRLLWRRDLPGLGELIPKNVDRNHVYSPRAAFLLGGDYVSVEDGVYVRLGRKCLRLDPASGETISTFELPDGAAWGFLAVWKDLLVAGAEPLGFSDPEDARGPESQRAFKPGKHPWNLTSSSRLVVMDRTSGKVLWQRDAAYGFRHSAIAVGGGRVFCVDRLPADVTAQITRRGNPSGDEPALIAFDARTGRVAWQTNENVTGSWLAYSEDHDCLVQGLDRVTAGGDYHGTFEMAVYRGEDGSLLWSKPQRVAETSCMLRGDEIIFGHRGLDLRTGEGRWSGFSRTKGCDAPLAGAHLLLFRSSMAGYLDLDNQSGTGNWGGFRSACNGSLIAANGVLSAAKSAQGCDCNVPNQTSLALVHMPEVEIWSHGGRRTETQGIGVNLGAPGDRLSEEGTFWLDYPSVGGQSPDVAVDTTPEAPDWFRRHSSWIDGDALPWVAASGAEGLRSVTITPDNRIESATVRLYFCEPASIKPGERVFSVSIQGRQVLTDFDIIEAAGGPNRAIVRDFKSIAVGNRLLVSLTPSESSSLAKPIICGIEVIADSLKQ